MTAYIRTSGKMFSEGSTKGFLKNLKFYQNIYRRLIYSTTNPNTPECWLTSTAPGVGPAPGPFVGCKSHTYNGLNTYPEPIPLVNFA
jgi:hypothetical protein